MKKQLRVDDFRIAIDWYKNTFSNSVDEIWVRDYGDISDMFLHTEPVYDPGVPTVYGINIRFHKEIPESFIVMVTVNHVNGEDAEQWAVWPYHSTIVLEGRLVKCNPKVDIAKIRGSNVRNPATAGLTAEVIGSNFPTAGTRRNRVRI
jgi:hypothetical protein